MSARERPPDINELRTFCTAADSGSLGRAALRLGVSQPALSKRLTSLEALAGTQLLERSSKGVKLTPAGRRLYDEARRLLEQSDKLEEVLLGLRRSGGPVRLAASHSANEAFASDLLVELGGEHPRERIEVGVRVGKDEGLDADLRSHRADSRSPAAT